jgi:hypothetical protein
MFVRMVIALSDPFIALTARRLLRTHVPFQEV